VLTDRKFFQGELEYLARIRSEVGLPLLRKDFIIDERQILESIQWGADAILLIASILDDQTLSRIYRLTSAAGLAVLVEVHDEIEMDRALAIGAELIGVNNRDLRTFKVDLSTTAKLAARLRANSNGARALLVAESGIHTKADVEHLVSSGARAVLVGESLMRHQDIKAKARELLGY
jgi:indole-3-glycerol phosphate synthase